MKNVDRQKFRPWLGIFLGLIFVSFTVSLAISQEMNFDKWDKAKKAFEKYFTYPSKENSCEALSSLPLTDRLKKLPWSFRAILNYEFNPAMLALDAESGNICAAQIISKLLKYDAASRHTFIFSIWRLIRNRPEMFIKTFSEENIKAFFLQWIFPTTLYKLSKERIVYEIKTRIDSLNSVSNPDLVEIKNKYIEFFEWYLSWKGMNEIKYIQEKDIVSSGEAPFEERIRQGMDAVIQVPSPENIRNLMGILSERVNIKKFIDVMSPQSSWSQIVHRLFEALTDESLCGNKYAIDFLFSFSDLFINPSPIYSGVMGEIMFVNPGVFIKSLKDYYEKLMMTSIAEYCCALPLWYQGDSIIFYERKIEALSQLNMPENKELIDLIIALLRLEVKKEKERSHKILAGVLMEEVPESI